MEDAIRYSARDSDATCRVDPVLARLHSDLGLERVEGIDLAALPMFERMQRVGMKINPKHFEDFSCYLQAKMDLLTEEVQTMTRTQVSLSSPDQVAELLYDTLGLHTNRMTKSKKRQSVDEKALAPLRKKHPVVPLIQEYKEAEKLKGTYADAIPILAGPDGRIHADFRTTITPTSQLAVREPNLLAMPVGELGKEIRRGFIAEDGHTLGSWDLQGFHFRVMAHLSNDPLLCKLFRDGRDVHSETASMMFGVPLAMVDKRRHRAPAKTIGLGIINGLTGRGLSEQFDIQAANGECDPHDEEESDRMIEAWFDIYKRVRVFQNDTIAECKRYGMVRDEWGRIRYLPNIHSALPYLKVEAERQSFSHKVQGTSHGVLKMAMAAIWEYMQGFWRDCPKAFWQFILQVHDELIAELEPSVVAFGHYSEDIKTLLCTTTELRVPLESSATFADNWADLKN